MRSEDRPTRRRVLAALGGLGIGSGAFRRALAAEAEREGRVTAEMIEQALWIAGLDLSDEQRESVARSMTEALAEIASLRKVPLDNSVPPAVTFFPDPSASAVTQFERDAAVPLDAADPTRPADEEDFAFLPVTELAALLRARQASSRELTELYLQRLRRFDPALLCLVTDTETLALEQAERADREIAAGRYRGPLHGIPWGVKDLFSVPGYPTTWGAPPYREQRLDVTATVVQRLEEAGAVLVAKLSVGALAMGDEWFRGRTRNPWNLHEGSSGSSAGSAAAAAAGLVGFAIGTETLGSIVSPCRRCGATGLRPTFGRVSRHGGMALSWTMDKVGPIARSVEDCALVFGAIHGRDGLDPAAVDRPFHWPARRDLSSLTVGYIEQETPADDRAELTVLRELGLRLKPIRLPESYPIRALTLILDVEAATAFDELTRGGVTEGLGAWPRIFRKGELIPAVEYLRAQRVRTLLMREMAEVMSGVDLYVGGDDLALTNLTGNPTVVLPNGLTERNGVQVPSSITFTGRLYGESELLAVAHAYQRETGYHLKRPPLGRLAEQGAD